MVHDATDGLRRRCIAYIQKNGNPALLAFSAVEVLTGTTSLHLIISTRMLSVAAADYFEVVLNVESDTSVNVNDTQGWFAIEMVA